jgi:drug/metabolite transporter (DMT)-like permease
MDWFLAAIVSAIALSGQVLAFQRLQRYFPIKVYMTYVWLGAALLLAIVYLRPADFAAIRANIIMLVLAGVSSWGGIYALNQSIKHQTNIGYIEAVGALRIIITYLFSIVAFNAPFEWIKLVGVILIMSGVFAVAGTLRVDLKQFKFDWVSWAVVAGLLFALLTIFVRYATDGGVTAEVATVVVLFIAGLLFLGSCVADQTPLRLGRGHIGLLAVAILFATVGNAAEFIAFEKAPNLAYAIAIDNTRLIILYIVGLVMFSEQLQRHKALGVLVTFVGVVLLS